MSSIPAKTRIPSFPVGLVSSPKACSRLGKLAQMVRGHKSSGPWLRGKVKAEDKKCQQRWEEALQSKRGKLYKEDLQQLVYGGMPMKYRHFIWMQLASQTSLQTGDVDKLQGFASDDVVARVAQDVSRTFPGTMEEAKLLSLQRVLLAYGAWNPAVGYCQGMNFMAAVFINLGFTESEALLGMSYFVEEVCPGCHNADLHGYHRDTAVLNRLLQRFMPELHSKLHRIGVPVNLIALDHFISLASRTWPLEATMRLWDIIFLEGPPAIFASFLALLELCIPGPHANKDGALTSDTTDVDASAFDVMESFKRDSLSAVTTQEDKVFAHIHRFLELIPKELIEELRVDVIGTN